MNGWVPRPPPPSPPAAALSFCIAGTVPGRLPRIHCKAVLGAAVSCSLDSFAAAEAQTRRLSIGSPLVLKNLTSLSPIVLDKAVRFLGLLVKGEASADELRILVESVVLSPSAQVVMKCVWELDHDHGWGRALA